MKVRIYKYKTNGIYEWGRGFVSGEVADKWHKFWEYVAVNKQTPMGKSVYLWRILTGDIGCDMLVTTGGSIYLHPTGGECVVQTINEVMPDGVFVELCMLMNACVEYIGNCTSVEMYSSKIRTVKE